ncbi:MAG: histidine phosphatase family protein [Parvularculaceae bacterium]|jgi:broad specificity phosphatase PhoE|nr:histidine phosphatase family protein [Parvularculaceae bacterium]
MSGRIITARHGRPNLSRDLKISSREYGAWWSQYDAAGLHPDEAPPPELVEIAARAKTVISSSLQRAVETARHVTKGERAVPADSIFVEAPLPPPPVPDFLKLRPGQWGVVSRALWILGYAPEGVETNRAAWERVDAIAGKLAEFSKSGDVLLCAHGWLNWMIDRRLRKSGWRRTGRDRGNDYWSWRVYERSAATVPASERAAAAAAE